MRVLTAVAVIAGLMLVAGADASHAEATAPSTERVVYFAMKGTPIGMPGVALDPGPVDGCQPGEIVLGEGGDGGCFPDITPGPVHCWRQDITMVSEAYAGNSRYKGYHYPQWCGDSVSVTQVVQSCDGEGDGAFQFDECNTHGGIEGLHTSEIAGDWHYSACYPTPSGCQSFQGGGFTAAYTLYPDGWIVGEWKTTGSGGA